MENYLKKYDFTFRELNVLELIGSIIQSIDEENSSNNRYGGISHKSEKHRNNNLIHTDKKAYFTEYQWAPRIGLDVYYEIDYTFIDRSVNYQQQNNERKATKEFSLRQCSRSLREFLKPLESDTCKTYEERIKGCPTDELSSISLYNYGRGFLGVTSIKVVKIGFPIPLVLSPGLSTKEKIFEVEEPLSFMKPYLEEFNIGDLYLSTSSGNRFIPIKALNPDWHKEVLFFDEMKSVNQIKIMVPYQYVIKHHELTRFNDSINEALLLPFIRKSPLKTHVFWRSISEASLYTVEYFNYNRRDYLHSLYFMKKEIFDKNTCTSSFETLPQGTYIVRICAEDRMGSIISKSRGIFVKKDSDISYPQDWLENVIDDIVVLQ